MEQEQVIKGYDPEIMRRLLRFAKPFRVHSVVAVVALAVATLGELAMPIVVQQAVDEHLLARWYRLNGGAAAEAATAADIGATATVIGDTAYVAFADVFDATGRSVDELQQAGVLSGASFYLTTVTPEVEPILTALRDSTNNTVDTETTVHIGDRLAAIPTAALDRLTAAQRRMVRAGDIAAIANKTWVFLGLLIAVLVATFVQVIAMALTGQGVMKDLRLSLFTQTVGQSLRFLGGQPVGRLVTRVTNDVETVNELFTSVLISLIKDVALMVGVIVTMFVVNTRLAWIATATLPPILVLTAVFRGHARDAFRQVRVRVSRVNAFLSEHISGMAVVQQFVRQAAVVARFKRENDDLQQANLAELFVFAIFRPTVDLFASASIAVVLFFAGGFFHSGLVSLGVLMAFVTLVDRFYRPVMDIAEKFTILQSAMAGGERVFQLLDQRDAIPDNGPSGTSAQVFDLRLDRVTFAYKTGEPVLRGIDLTIPAGSTAAVVGYTGAGKTTIANLITRLWDVDAGSIRLGGRDVREYPLDYLRTVVQPIQQDVFLFSTTIRENITLGKKVDNAAMAAIVEKAQLGSLVAALPDGLDTMLSEGASNISTGQRQLLSFARILAHDPRVIIMDEATSNIDSETERLIQAAMREVLRDRTSVVIAHRLSTIKNADIIVVLASGRVAEQGTHTELIAKRGLYHTLYQLQFDPSPV